MTATGMESSDSMECWSGAEAASGDLIGWIAPAPGGVATSGVRGRFVADDLLDSSTSIFEKEEVQL